MSTEIVLAAGRTIVKQHDAELLADESSPSILTTTWAKSLLQRMGYVKRKGCSVKKLQVNDYEAVRQQFLTDIEAVVTLEDIPSQLVLNWDHTGVNIVPSSSWTMEQRGKKHVEVIALDDKRQITAVICGTLSGDVLPLQLIYQGKTPACLPKISFPEGWLISYTPNHWSNEEKTHEYINKVIVPYLKAKRKEIGVEESFPALALFDAFKGQTTTATYELLAKNNIYAVSIPANCTDKLQPMDLSVNKCFKDHLKGQFSKWYSSKVYQQSRPTPVDLRLSLVKPLSAKWIVNAHGYLMENREIIKNGFKDAGITDILTDGFQPA